MVSLNSNTTLAAVYAQNGVRVFPCREKDTSAGKVKAPYTRDGYHSASSVQYVLSLWSSMYPHAIYGLPCAPNGLFVLDADRHGGEDGVKSLTTLFAHYHFDLRTVPVVGTPGDGLHIIFHRPYELGQTKRTVAPAVDVRNLGYIIAPGTFLPDGRAYQLKNGTIKELAAAISNRTLPPMPPWLIELAISPSKAGGARQLSASGVSTGRQIDGIMNTVRRATVGGRNSALHWAACRCGELVTTGFMTIIDANNLLYQAGQAAGLDEREVKNTVASGMRKGMAGQRHGN